MLRSNILYRRLWYMKKRNIKRIHIFFRLTIALFILSLPVSFVAGWVMPGIQRVSEQKVQAVLTSTIEATVSEIITNNHVYDDIVKTSRGTEGNINSIQLDTAELNGIMSIVYNKLRERLEMQDIKSIDIPFGNLLKSSSLNNIGPYFNIRIRQIGSIETNYSSEFIPEAVNQTKHIVFINIITNISYSGPFLNGSTVVTDSFPIIEEVIVGKV
jgi:sporulation protein YunB